MEQHLDAAIVYAIGALLVGEFSVMSLKHGHRMRRIQTPPGSVFVTYLLGSLAWPLMLVVMIVAGRAKAAERKGPWDAR
jgi:hypothetical protein